MQVQEDVAALRVGPMHKRVHEQLAHDGFVEGRHLRAEHPIG
jgi:hypothetical protein